MRAILLLLTTLALLWPAAAEAAVRIDFRSRDTDSRFPHAFVVLTGVIDATGKAVDDNYGFTLLETINVSILLRPADGQIHSVRPTDIPNSNLHFSLTLSDEEYQKVVDMVMVWRRLPQPSYRLHQRNCVTFVQAMATLLGLDASMRSGLDLKPHSFLDSVRDRNRDLILARGGAVGPISPPVTIAAAAAGATPQPAN